MLTTEKMLGNDFSVPSYLVDQAPHATYTWYHFPTTLTATLPSQDWHGSRASGWGTWNRIAGLVVTAPEEDARPHICTQIND